jgi:DNA-binding protein H-NS
MATYSELIAQRDEIARQQAALEKAIADQLKEQRAGAIQQVKAIMAEFGLTAADLSGGKAPRQPKGESGAGSKVAAKYRDPATGTTWSGRGLKPKWLKAALESGKTIDDFSL